MANLYRQPRSRMWYLQWYSPVDRKRHAISLRTADKKIAKARKAEKERELALNRSHVGLASMTFTGGMMRYLEAVKPQKCQDAHYGDQVKARILNRCLGHQSITSLTPGHVEDALNRIHKERKLSTRTRDHYLKLARSMSRWCVFRGFILHDFTEGVKRLGFVKRPRRFMPRDQWDELLKLSEGSQWHPMVAVGLFAGLRMEELFNLEWTDMDLSSERPFIHVAPKRFWSPKSKEDRYVPIPDQLRAILVPYNKAQGLCFWGPAAHPQDS